MIILPLKLNINDIIALYKDGVSVKKISERYNCSDTTIRNKLRQNGVKLKNKRITKEKSQQIATMYNSGADVKDLAKLFGLNPVTIRKHIKKHGIELRNNMIILSENQLREIKNLLATNVSLSEIGRRYNLSPSSIGKVLERYGVYKIKQAPKRLTELEKKTIVKLKESGYNTVQIAEKINRSDSSVGKFLIKKGYLNLGNYQEKLNDKMKEEIKYLYTEQRQTVSQIRENFGYNFVSSGTIEKYLRSIGVIRPGGNFNWSNNVDYFKNIDSPEKAYVAGYITADGSINNKGQIILDCATKDREILEFIRDQVTPNNIIHDYYREDKKNPYFSHCTLGSSAMREDLRKLNIVQNKQSLNLPFPKLHEPLYRDFIRGYFDGDGSVFSIKNTIKISICANEKQSEDLEEILKRNGVITKPNKNIIDMRKYGNDIFNLRIIRKKDVRNFFQYIYYDARQFKLKRKYNIFLEHM